MPFFCSRFVRRGFAESRSKPHDIGAVARFLVVDWAGFGIFQPYVSQIVGKPAVTGSVRIDCGYDFVCLPRFGPIEHPGPPRSSHYVAAPQNKSEGKSRDSKDERILLSEGGNKFHRKLPLFH